MLITVVQLVDLPMMMCVMCCVLMCCRRLMALSVNGRYSLSTSLSTVSKSAVHVCLQVVHLSPVVELCELQTPVDIIGLTTEQQLTCKQIP